MCAGSSADVGRNSGLIYYCTGAFVEATDIVSRVSWKSEDTPLDFADEVAKVFT